MNALSVVGKVQERNLEGHQVQNKKHWGDFTCEEFQEFRTFFMTCTCGWKTPVKIVEGSFRGYYLQNLWEMHLGPTKQTRISIHEAGK